MKDVLISLIVSSSCDFELGLCPGWRQSNSDVFDWTRHTTSPPSRDTGPDYDHTSGSGKRKIIYFLFFIASFVLFSIHIFRVGAIRVLFLPLLFSPDVDLFLFNPMGYLVL